MRENFVPGRILCREDFVPGRILCLEDFVPGRILYREANVPAGFCGWRQTCGILQYHYGSQNAKILDAIFISEDILFLLKHFYSLCEHFLNALAVKKEAKSKSMI